MNTVPTNTLKVIQWTTGKVGTLALRAILDDPRLELVGVYAYSDSKSGVDAGQLCGRPVRADAVALGRGIRVRGNGPNTAGGESLPT